MKLAVNTSRTHWDPDVIKPEVWIDFHHTISNKCGACEDEIPGELCAGEPQEGVREAFERFHELGLDIVIYTGYGTFIGDYIRAELEIWSWLKVHDLDRFISKIRTDKPTWFLFIGDRASNHVDWNTTLEDVNRIYERDIGKEEGEE